MLCRDVACNISRVFFLHFGKADGLGLQGRDLSNSQMGALPKSVLCIVNCLKLVKRQGRIVELTCCNCLQWILTFFSFDPSNLCREATPVTPAVKRALKVMIYDMKVLHILLG